MGNELLGMVNSFPDVQGHQQRFEVSLKLGISEPELRGQTGSKRGCQLTSPDLDCLHNKTPMSKKKLRVRKAQGKDKHKAYVKDEAITQHLT